MSNSTSVLRIDSSARGSASVAKQLTRYLIDQFAREEAIELWQRDLGEQPLVPITATTTWCSDWEDSAAVKTLLPGIIQPAIVGPLSVCCKLTPARF